MNNELRKNVLPGWIWLASWIFVLLLGALPLLVIITSQRNLDLSIHGLYSKDFVSSTGALIFGLIVSKGTVAYMLLDGQRKAVKYALVEGTFAFLITFYAMIFELRFQFEILVLALYILSLIKLKSKWEKI